MIDVLISFCIFWVFLDVFVFSGFFSLDVSRRKLEPTVGVVLVDAIKLGRFES